MLKDTSMEEIVCDIQLVGSGHSNVELTHLAMQHNLLEKNMCPDIV